MQHSQPTPTTRQLAFLRALSVRTGTTFVMPSTRRQACRAIQALVDRPASSQLELELDRVAIRGGEIAEAA